MGEESGVASGLTARPQTGTTGAATLSGWVATKPTDAGFCYVDSVGELDDGVRYGNIATVWSNEGDALSTARLFAAAPQMLAALKALSKAVAHGDVAGLLLAEEPAHWSNIGDAMRLSRTAIAKAEGR
jgi:hypothetical protein